MSLFKRPAAHYGESPEPETPYQRAAQVWDDRIGSARVQARNWRIMAFGSLFLSAGFAAALVWQSARGTVVPWVVQLSITSWLLTHTRTPSSDSGPVRCQSD